MRKKLEQLLSDPYRPMYNFVNPEGNLNDPNGLCYWKGNWHLFYQAYPPEDPRQHWGYAISKNLIHWKDLPLAIYPNPEKRYHSWAAFVENDRVIVAYSGFNNRLMIAVSSDPLLLNWQKKNLYFFDYNTKKKSKATGGDACIWKSGEYYYALTGEKQGEGKKRIRTEYLHRSKNLCEWEVNMQCYKKTK